MDVSLVIPTFGRPERLVRMLHLYAAIGFEGQLLIGDASDDEAAARVVAAIAETGVRARHFHWPGLATTPTFVRLTEQLDTAYAAYAGDDDYYWPDGVARAIAWLEAHPDASAAGGRRRFFRVVDGRAEGLTSNREPAVLASTAAGRVEQFMTRYWVSLFTVHRADSWRRMWAGTDAVADPWFSGELIPSARAAAHGPIGRLPGLQLLREVHDAHVSHQGSTSSRLAWMCKPDFSAGCQAFLDLVSAEVAAVDGCDAEAARPAVHRGLTHYFFPRPRDAWTRKLAARADRWRQLGDRLVGRDRAALDAISTAVRETSGRPSGEG